MVGSHFSDESPLVCCLRKIHMYIYIYLSIRHVCIIYIYMYIHTIFHMISVYLNYITDDECHNVILVR